MSSMNEPIRWNEPVSAHIRSLVDNMLVVDVEKRLTFENLFVLAEEWNKHMNLHIFDYNE